MFGHQCIQGKFVVPLTSTALTTAFRSQMIVFVVMEICVKFVHTVALTL